jgi:hypothetical protein
MAKDSLNIIYNSSITNQSELLMLYNILIFAAKRDDQGESKVWPPPKAPDYMKSVKDLPSGVKVVHEREKPEGGDGASQYATEVHRRSDPTQPNTGNASKKCLCKGYFNAAAPYKV